MEGALPAIEKHLRERWCEGGSRALAAALGVRGPTAATGTWEAVRTCATLTTDDVAALENGKSAEALIPVRALAWQVLVAGSARLYALVAGCLDIEVQPLQPDASLAQRVGLAKQALDVDVVDVLVQRFTRGRILNDDRLGKGVAAHLDGGSLVPVMSPHLDQARAYVIPHQTGQVVVEGDDRLSVQWDTADAGQVDIIATDRFRLRSADLRAIEIEVPWADA